mgnify:CR=1 FL=1
MPNHQQRRRSLPADYQFPTGTTPDVTTAQPCDRRQCPNCGGPSLRGDLCFSCTSQGLEPTYDTPWAV